MPNISYYDDVKIIKKPFKKRFSSVVKFFLILAIVIGCFVGATYISSALTVGNIGSIIVYGGKTVKYGKSTLYAVTLGVYDTYDEAERVALGTTIQGASGYVWEQENRYYVIGNIYSSMEDANKVIENIAGTKYNTGVLEINFNKLNLSFDSYENSDMTVVKKSFEMFDEIYAELYNYSIKYDKGEIVHLAVSSNISNLRGEVKGLIVGVQNLINKNDSVLSIVQDYLVRLDEVLNQAILKTIDNTSTNYSLKNSIASVVRLKYELFNKLS